jgi:hypothetical protein
MRVPPGWDYEDLGCQAPQRWDFLVKSPLGWSNSGGIHITRLVGATAGEQLAKRDIEEISKNRKVRSSVEETAAIGKRSARVTTITFEPVRHISFYRVFVVTVSNVSWVIRCVMDDPDDLHLAGALEGILKELALRDSTPQ